MKLREFIEFAAIVIATALVSFWLGVHHHALSYLPQ